MAKVLYLRADSDEAAVAAIRTAFPAARMHTSAQSWAFIRSGLHIRLLAGPARNGLADDDGPWRRIEVRGCAQECRGPWDGYVQAAFDVADHLAGLWGGRRTVRFDPDDPVLTTALVARSRQPTICDAPTGWRPYVFDRPTKRRHRRSFRDDVVTGLRRGR